MKYPCLIRIVVKMIVCKTVKRKKMYCEPWNTVQTADLIIEGIFGTMRPGLVTVEKHFGECRNGELRFHTAENLPLFNRNMQPVDPGNEILCSCSIVYAPAYFHGFDSLIGDCPRYQFFITIQDKAHVDSFFAAAQPAQKNCTL